jgi:multicomponent Na+:H+ antiporter subunit D
MFTAIIMLFFGKKSPVGGALALAAAVINLGVAFFLLFYVREHGMLVFLASGWAPPFAIVLDMDVFSCIMIILSSVTLFTNVLYSFFTVDKKRKQNYFYILVQFLTMGVNGAFITGDIFNMFVFFEIMLISSYALMAIGSDKGQLRETFKYMLLNILASGLFLVAVGVLYSVVGSMNMADIAQKLASIENQGFTTVIGMMFLVVFGIKGGLFPLFFWLPQTYTEPPATVSAVFGSLLTKVGVYCLIRSFTLMFSGNTKFITTIILIVAAGTMLFGVIGAVGKFGFKSILSYHIISQVGYMVMGLGLYSVFGLAGGIFYIAHHIIVKNCLFLTQGVTVMISGTDNIREMGGMLKKYPTLGWTFLIAAISLAGVPPLSGFFSKFMLIQDAIAQGNYWIAVVAVLVSFLTLMSLIKVFIYVFWGEEKPLPEPAPGLKRRYRGALIPCMLLAAISLAMGICAQPMIDVALEASEQLLNPQYFIDAVMAVAGSR